MRAASTRWRRTCAGTGSALKGWRLLCRSGMAAYSSFASPKVFSTPYFCDAALAAAGTLSTMATTSAPAARYPAT